MILSYFRHMRRSFNFFLFLFPVSMFSQVYNGDFEEYIQIPTELGQWQLISGWTNAGSSVSSPDYYHSNGTEQTDFPETPYAVVPAKTGEAFVGMRVCGKAGTSSREYLSARLINPMVVNQSYRLSFKVTNGEYTSVSNAGLVINHLGVALTEGELMQTLSEPILIEPKCMLESILTNDTWVEYSFIVTADSPYRFITIGLFGPDEQHQILSKWGDNPQYAYYFFDDIKITTVSSTTEENHKLPIDRPQPVFSNPNEYAQYCFIPNTFSPNLDGSNEYFNIVPTIIQDYTLSVFGKWGDELYHGNHLSVGWDGTYNGLDCPDGAYIWQLNFDRTLDTGKKIPMEFKGLVNVIR